MTPIKTDVYCWYCGKLLHLAEYKSKIGGLPEYTFECRNHMPYVVQFNMVESAIDSSMLLIETEINIKPGIWACTFVSNDKPYWFVGPTIYEMTDDMLQLSPEQLGNKIKKLLAFI